MHPTQDVVAATQDFDLIAMDVTSYEEFLNHECKTIDRRRREVDRQLELLILRGKQLERELYERERDRNTDTNRKNQQHEHGAKSINSTLKESENKKRCESDTKKIGHISVTNDSNTGSNSDKAMDNQQKQRGKRVLGQMLVHLQKSKQELNKESDLLKRKEEIEKRVDRKVSERRWQELEEHMKRNEREFQEKRKEMDQLTQKLYDFRQMKDRFFSQSEKNKEASLLATIVTPIVHYLPKKLTEKQKDKILNQKKMALEQTKQLKNEFRALLEQYGIDERELFNQFGKKRRIDAI
jgi:hypothetical protein